MAANDHRVLLQGQLTCVLCKEIFQDPVTLACCHSFCKKCLISHITEDNYGSSSKCPVCQVSITFDTIQLQVNNVLSEIVTALQINQEKHNTVKDNVMCQICDASIASGNALKCLDCKITYCHPCRETYHPNKGVLEKHVINALTDKLFEFENMFTECSTHNKEFVYHCVMCDVSVCIDCHNEAHKGHTFDVLSKASNDQRARVTSAIHAAEQEQKRTSEGIDRQKQHLCLMQNNQKQRISCVKKCFESLREALDAKEKQLLNEEENIVGETISKYDNLIKETASLMLQLDCILSVAKSTIVDGHEIMLLMLSKSLSLGLNKLTSSLLIAEADSFPFIHPAPATIDTTDALYIISSLGTELNSNSDTPPEGCPKVEHHVQSGVTENHPTQTAFSPQPIDSGEMTGPILAMSCRPKHSSVATAKAVFRDEDGRDFTFVYDMDAHNAEVNSVSMTNASPVSHTGDSSGGVPL